MADDRFLFLVASPLSVPPSLTAQTLLITSSTLSSAETVSFPAPEDPASTLTVSGSELIKKLVEKYKAEGAATAEAEFVVKGQEPA